MNRTATDKVRQRQCAANRHVAEIDSSFAGSDRVGDLAAAIRSLPRRIANARKCRDQRQAKNSFFRFCTEVKIPLDKSMREIERGTQAHRRYVEPDTVESSPNPAASAGNRAKHVKIDEMNVAFEPRKVQQQTRFVTCHTRNSERSAVYRHRRRKSGTGKIQPFPETAIDQRKFVVKSATPECQLVFKDDLAQSHSFGKPVHLNVDIAGYNDVAQPKHTLTRAGDLLQLLEKDAGRNDGQFSP